MGPGNGNRKRVNSNLVSVPRTNEGVVSSGTRRSLLFNANQSAPMPTTEHGVTSSGGRQSHRNDNHIPRPNTRAAVINSGGRGVHINANRVPVSNTQHGVTSSGGQSHINDNHIPLPNTQDVVMNSGGSGSHSANHVPTPSTQDGASSSGTKKNVRKKSVNKKLTEFLRLGGNVRPVIEILPELTVPVGPWAKEYSSEIGIIVRQHAPLCCHTWREVKKHRTYQTLFEQVLKRFNMDFRQPHVVSAVDGHLKKLFKEYRHDLHSHYLSLPDNVDKSQHPKEDVAQDKWASLCVWWESEEFKKKSATNKRSRSKLEVLHRGGAKNFARHRFDLTNPETNEQPNDIELYRFTHHNLKKGWVAPCAEENYDRMVEMSTHPTEEGGEPLTAEGAREAVLGKRPGYSCGLGYGVLAPTRATAAATAAAAAAGAAATAAARAEMDAMRQRAEVAENQLRQLTDQHHQLRDEHLQLTDQQTIQARQIEYLMSRFGVQPNAP